MSPDTQTPGSWHTFCLRLLKASWGISIDLTARRVNLDSSPTGATLLADRLWLDVSAAKLTPDDIGQLLQGLRTVVPRLTPAPDNRHEVIEIRAIAYPPTDYQPEGVAVAIMRWACNEFGLPHPAIDVRFDRSTNHYQITF